MDDPSHFHLAFRTSTMGRPWQSLPAKVTVYPCQLWAWPAQCGNPRHLHPTPAIWSCVQNRLSSRVLHGLWYVQLVSSNHLSLFVAIFWNSIPVSLALCLLLRSKTEIDCWCKMVTEWHQLRVEKLSFYPCRRTVNHPLDVSEASISFITAVSSLARNSSVSANITVCHQPSKRTGHPHILTRVIHFQNHTKELGFTIFSTWNRKLAKRNWTPHSTLTCLFLKMPSDLASLVGQFSLLWNHLG